jgi:zinc finger protein
LSLTTSSPCPICAAEVEFFWKTEDLPHFGETMIVSGTCSCCGFKHIDTIPLSQKEPSRYTIEVSELDDLDARVIRSCSGTVHVPELGVDIEPGPASESYLTNIEGVLDRIEGIVNFATRSAREAGDLEKTSAGEAILDMISRARQGQFGFTMVIEDPMGNSAIISPKAIKSTLTKEEIANLKTGMTIVDVQKE